MTEKPIPTNIIVHQIITRKRAMEKQNRILNVGAYQFAVSGNIEQNLSEIRK